MTDLNHVRTNELAEARFANYERHVWAEPQLASLRMLVDDLRGMGHITHETWGRFTAEESTYGAEVLDTSQRRVDRLRFDGRDIIVKEGYGSQGRITLRDVYERGLDRARRKAEQDPVIFNFQLTRDAAFMNAYEEVGQMMRGETDYDTIKMTSTCPTVAELASQLLVAGRFETEAEAFEGATELLQSEHYNTDWQKAYHYIFRRTKDGWLEMLCDRLDGSNLEAHEQVLRQSYGHDTVDFCSLSSHDYGRYIAKVTTGSRPIEAVADDDIVLYDHALTVKTGQRHRRGRRDDSIDAHVFFEQHCPEYWAAYAGHHELLARHLVGEPLAGELGGYLRDALACQAQASQSVLTAAECYRLSAQIDGGRITLDMVRSCRNLMVYSHHAVLDQLLREYRRAGRVRRLADESAGGLMVAYGEAASSAGGVAADEGRAFNSDCGIGTSLVAAAELAQRKAISLEQAQRLLARKTELTRKWRRGDCQNCLTKGTRVGECAICAACESIHNKEGNRGLDRVRRRALTRLREAEEPGFIEGLFRVFFPNVATEESRDSSRDDRAA